MFKEALQRLMPRLDVANPLNRDWQVRKTFVKPTPSEAGATSVATTATIKLEDLQSERAESTATKADILSLVASLRNDSLCEKPNRDRHSTLQMYNRNLLKTNSLLKLGGGSEIANKGKMQIKGTKATKKETADAYFPIEQGAKLPVPTNAMR